MLVYIYYEYLSGFSFCDLKLKEIDGFFFKGVLKIIFRLEKVQV